MVNTTLSDVTLTMIVRDELMNPAGGLHAMLTHHLPWFEHVVVLDTGSVDGTRQLLEHLQGKYPQLKVYDARFKGYAAARNTANEHVRTTWALALDADEFIPSELNIEKYVTETLKQKPDLEGISFQILGVYPDGECRAKFYAEYWNPRFYQVAKALFTRRVYGLLKVGDGTHIENPLFREAIYEFVPEIEDRQMKCRKIYYRWCLPIPSFLMRAPSRVKGFTQWKTPNPQCLRKYGIDVFAVLTELDKIGLKPHPKIVEQLEQYRRNTRD